ncbi:tubulointerstitial nephritis antigen-like [Polypterus senegalus]|uniref:tubulointerstitial nephritis antigen-like n=1 Tax=Polypterus senegalus TaxID=55291 RepID=UPI001963CABB|nr:tubulointerstitial nephritis antigen-like [Polypterus senegalus]
MKIYAVVLVLVLFLMCFGELQASRLRTRRELKPPLHYHGIRDPNGSYCERRGGCCPGRDDTCIMKYMDTICYCDLFCNRTVSDCCPDFWRKCLGIPPPPPPYSNGKVCHRNGQQYTLGATYKENCNMCTCTDQGLWTCEQNVCLIDTEMINSINSGNYGWKAGNYSQFWGMTLNEAISYRLGTKKPSSTVMNMHEVQMDMGTEFLPRYFNAAEKWPGMIHEPLDQGNCAASWAFSTAAVASDRISIQSMGHMTPLLSPQNLISCDTRNQAGCNGGRIDGAWWYLRRKGIVTEECYPFTGLHTDAGSHGNRCMVQTGSIGRGKRQAITHCPNAQSSSNEIYKTTPPYRLSSNEKEIMKEIMKNGPVQAIMEVHEDFFIYKSGIYRHIPLNENKAPQYRKHGTHSVRIIGWGEEWGLNGETLKYWMAANSWGKNWGENGYFKIARGENECQIEAFVIGVWGHVTMEDMHHHHK